MVDLTKFGVDAAQVASLRPAIGYAYPNPVSGRVAHIDADFMAYQVSAESKAELDEEDPTPRKTYEDMLHNAYEAVDHIRRLAGAERAVLHTTHNSDKGGRDNYAMLKEYQANRKDRTNKPEQLDNIRVFLGSGVGDTTGTFVGCNHTDQEADDGMAQAHYADPENSIICSSDKDLWMVPGWRLNMKTNKPEFQKCPFGHIEILETGGGTTPEGKKKPITRKVVGAGTKYFWAQCLMGDTADNISGVPAAPGKMWQQYSGTAEYQKTYQQWIEAEAGKQSAKLDEKLKKLTAKHKLCGPMLTYALLKDARDDAECYRTVKACYTLLAEDHGYEFKNYRNGKVITPTQALLSEMRLLWMRRYKDPEDVIKWIKGIVK